MELSMVRVDKDLAFKAKIEAVKEGMTLQAWLDRAIREGLKKKK